MPYTFPTGAGGLPPADPRRMAAGQAAERGALVREVARLRARVDAADALIAFEREHRYGLILESEIEEHEALEAAYDDAAREGQ